MARQNENRSKFEYQSANVIFHSSTCSKTGDIMLQSSHTAPFLLLSKKQILWCSSSKLHLKNVSAKSRHWDRVCGLKVSPEADRKPDLQTSTYFPFFASFPHTWIKVWHSISGLLNKVVNKYGHTLQSQNQIEKLQVTTSGQIQEEILFMRWFVTYKDSCQTRNNLKLNLLGQFSQEGGSLINEQQKCAIHFHHYLEVSTVVNLVITSSQVKTFNRLSPQWTQYLK